MRKMILAAATLAALAMMPASANAQSSTVGGAIVGAGTGAVIGGAVGGGRGAAVGAVVHKNLKPKEALDLFKSLKAESERDIAGASFRGAAE